MSQNHTARGLNPWYIIGWLVLAAIVVLAALAVLGAPRDDPAFALVGVILAAWAILGVAAMRLYRWMGSRGSAS